MEHHQVHYPGGGTGDGPRPSDRSICQLPQARAEDYADAAAPALSAARRHGGPQLADDALRQLRHHQPVPEGTGPAGVQLVHGHKNGLRHDPADRARHGAAVFVHLRVLREKLPVHGSGRAALGLYGLTLELDPV